MLDVNVDRQASTGRTVFLASAASFLLWLLASEGLHNHVRFLLDMAARLAGR
jgi:hypothetical protein